MRTRLIIVGLLVFSNLLALAQNVVKAEYYVDTDPGIGSATDVAVTAATTVQNVNFDIALSAYPDGLHQLYFRVKDSNGFWSCTERTAFYRYTFSTTSITPAANITNAEYFIDIDPGYGNATATAVTPGLTITDVPLSINISALTDGNHRIFARFKDANGAWSATEGTFFYKLTITTPTVPAIANITSAEYFIDADPGIGSGTAISVTQGQALINVLLPIDVSALPAGNHKLSVRVKDANGIWSPTESTSFYNLTITTTAPPAAAPISVAEYFVDSDPGFGSGTAISITSGFAITNLLLQLDVSSLTEATHTVFVRFKDTNGIWSVTQPTNFSVCNQAVPVSAAASAVAPTSFMANWTGTTGATGYQLDVSPDNFATFLSGYGPKVITGQTTSFSVTGLTQASTYQYRVRAITSCVSVSSSVISVTTLATPPNYEPYGFTFPNLGSTSLTLSYNYPTTLPTGFVAIRSVGAATTFVPTNNTPYSIGQVAGDGVVAYAGPSLTFNETTLSATTLYYYTFFPYNQIGNNITYLTTTPAVTSVTTRSSEPGAGPANLQFSNVISTGFTVTFSAPAVTPDGYIVIRKIGAASASVPVDGADYTTYVGSDQVAYQGSSTAFTETTLTQNTNYFYIIYAFNGTGANINYLTTAPLQGNQLTPLTPPTSQPSNLAFSNVTPGSITVSYSAGGGSPSGYLAVRKIGSATSFVPQFNTSYTAGQDTGDGSIAFVGSGLTFTDGGLSASTTYFYTIFDFIQNGTLVSYRTASPLNGNKATFTGEPTSQPTSVVFSNISATGLHVSFSDANPVPSGYLALRKSVSAPTGIPIDGTSNNTSATLGDGIVAFAGSGTGFDDTGLLPGTAYFYEIFSFNGSGTSTNYLASVAAGNSGSVVTIPDKVVISPATGVQQNQFTAGWSTATGATSYQLDVSSDNFATLLPGFTSPIKTANATIAGLAPGTAYQYQVRAINASGASVNSDPAQQITIPLTPTLAGTTKVTQNDFNIHWASVPGTTNYFVDVASDVSFSAASTQSNYNNVSVLAPIDTLAVTGLAAGEKFYFRVRSADIGGASPSSSLGNQLLIPATPVGLDAANTTQTSFKAKWGTATGATEYRIDITLAANNFNPPISKYTDVSVTDNIEYFVTDLDANTAYAYRIRALNASGTSPSSLPISVVTLQGNQDGGIISHDIQIPNGGTQLDYRIVSIPQGSTASSGLTSGSYLKNWRLMHWSEDQNENLDVKNVTTIQPMLGYWVNSNINPAPTIQVGGTFLQQPAVLSLEPGWNQIGNPFNFDISWSDVLAQNSTVTGIAGIGNLFTYDVPTVSGLQPFSQYDGLLTFGGGFVNNENTSVVKITVPLTVKEFNGRVAVPQHQVTGTDLTSKEWFVPLTLQVGANANNLGGIGMHPDASKSIDPYDAIALPRFFTYVDLSSGHPEFFEPSFMRDVVPSLPKYDWTFAASSNSEDPTAILKWDNTSFENSDVQLILYDVTEAKFTDMRKLNHYNFQLKESHSLRFFYSADGTLSPDITGVGTPYPNPFSESTVIPFVTHAVSENVQISLIDITGKPVRMLFNGGVAPGYHEAQWNGSDDRGERVPSGIYLYRFNSSEAPGRVGKIILK